MPDWHLECYKEQQYGPTQLKMFMAKLVLQKVHLVHAAPARPHTSGSHVTSQSGPASGNYTACQDNDIVTAYGEAGIISLVDSVQSLGSLQAGLGHYLIDVSCRVIYFDRPLLASSFVRCT